MKLKISFSAFSNYPSTEQHFKITPPPSISSTSVSPQELLKLLHVYIMINPGKLPSPITSAIKEGTEVMFLPPFVGLLAR